jgi:hypothetical protein
MTEEQRAIALIFEKLYADGLQWYRRSNAAGATHFANNLKAVYSIVDRSRVEQIRWSERSSFPARHVAILVPPDRDPEPLLAVWCRWDFDLEPARCGFYIGLWTKLRVSHEFVGFRFESPEDGEQHDFYHCQPCRNLGDRGSPEPTAVAISEYVPTLALHADNSAELALNIVLAMRGKLGLEQFRRAIMLEPEARNSEILKQGFRRLKSLPASLEPGQQPTPTPGTTA